jgi:hypothetical protein
MSKNVSQGDECLYRNVVNRCFPNFEDDEPFDIGTIESSWEDKTKDAMSNFRETLDTSFKMISLEAKVLELEGKVKRLEPDSVVISSLACYGINVLKPIFVTIKEDGGDYYATWYDSGISTSGDTPEEVTLNLRELISETFKMLLEYSDADLGRAMLQQKLTLQDFLEIKNGTH